MTDHRTTDLDDAALAARVHDACEAWAARVPVADEPFDPSRPGLAIEEDAASGRGARRRPALLAAAAVVAVLGLGAVAVSVAGRDGGEPAPVVTGADPSTSTSGAVTSTPVAPDPSPGVAVVPDLEVLAPSADPDGLALQDVSWWSTPSSDGPRSQLFGVDGAPEARVLVLVWPANPGSSGSGDAVSVRGFAGRSDPSKEVPERSTTVTWQDEGASLEARFVGVDQAGAVALLDGLAWREADRRAGFDPGPGAVLLGESIADAAAVDTLRLVYRDAPTSAAVGEGRQLIVSTTSAAGGPSLDHLEAWLLGGRDADGGARSWDPAFGTLSIAASDGSSAFGDANGTSVAEAEIQAVLDSLAPTDGAGVLGLRSRAEAASAARPLLGSVELPSGTVELRGDPGTEVVCLVRPGADRRCSMNGSDVATTAGFLIDGRWWVVAVEEGPAVSVWEPGAHPSRDEGSEVEAERGTIGGRTAVLAEPGGGLASVDVWVAETSASSVRRPVA